jgi:ubiquinone/menaquinone biosynthesis C-methylase UbiE
VTIDLQVRRKAEIEKYRQVYRDYPRYTNRQVRIDLTREWIESHPGVDWLLDVGCGRGEVVDMARNLGLGVRGCDVVPELCCPGEGIDLIAGAHRLPYSSNKFDLVTCTDVMEHILEDDVPTVLSEMARVSCGPILLVICHIPDRPGKYGPDALHVTVQLRTWWENKIREHMGVDPRVLYGDRVNSNGTWFEVTCK